MTYHIVDWERRFENNRTRDLKKLGWVPVPNHHDGDGYTTLMEMDNGMLLYAAWMLMVQVASKCGTRGTLVRDSGTPHDAASLARVTRGRKEAFEAAFPVLIEIGWLSSTPQVGAIKPHHVAEKSLPPAVAPHESAILSQSHACAGVRAERKKEGSEGKERTHPPETAPAVSDGKLSDEALAEEVYQTYPRKIGKPEAISHIAKRLKKLPDYAAKIAERDRLIEHVKTYAASEPYPAFMHASTFFHTHMDDDPEAWSRETVQAKPPPRPVRTVNDLIQSGELAPAEFGVTDGIDFGKDKSEVPY